MQIRFATVEFSGTDGISLSLSLFPSRDRIIARNNNFCKRIDDKNAILSRLFAKIDKFFILNINERFHLTCEYQFPSCRENRFPLDKCFQL